MALIGHCCLCCLLHVGMMQMDQIFVGCVVYIAQKSTCNGSTEYKLLYSIFLPSRPPCQPGLMGTNRSFAVSYFNLLPLPQNVMT